MHYCFWHSLNLKKKTFKVLKRKNLCQHILLSLPMYVYSLHIIKKIRYQANNLNGQLGNIDSEMTFFICFQQVHHKIETINNDTRTAWDLKFSIVVDPSLVIITLYSVCLIFVWVDNILKQIMHLNETTYMSKSYFKNQGIMNFTMLMVLSSVIITVCSVCPIFAWG